MIFGKNQDKGIKLDGFSPEVVSIKDNVSTDDLLIHDEKDRNLASILANFTENESLPTPIGVFYSEEKRVRNFPQARLYVCYSHYSKALLAPFTLFRSTIHVTYKHYLHYSHYLHFA